MKNDSPKGTKTGSLRWRLALVSLAMLVVALVALDAAIYTNLRQRYYNDLRAELNSAVSHSYDVPWIKTNRPSSIAKSLSATNVVAIVDRPGVYPAVGKKIGYETKLPAIAGPPANADESQAQFIIDVKSNPNLIWKPASPFGSRGDYVLFVASKAPANAALRRLLVAELIGTLLVLGIVMLVLTSVVRLILRPLDRMAIVADSITAGDIRQRLRPSKKKTELGKLATALDKMLDSLAFSLTSERQAHARASRSEERMRNFLSDASHELRTPIAGLQWSAEALLRHGEERERREQLSFEIAKQARRASQLVGDLLAMARLDQGLKLERKPIDLSELAAEEVERVREQEPRIKLQLASESDCPLVGDADRIRQVIANLIDNARKAMGGEGEIDVSVRRNGKFAELVVRDSGPGVPADERERIFERFVRLDEARRSSKYGYGSGLGLAIARSIAEAHGGKLVCAESDAGARFVLEIPLSGRAKWRGATSTAQVS
jgi:signal transduction histidine kinase